MWDGNSIRIWKVEDTRNSPNLKTLRSVIPEFTDTNQFVAKINNLIRVLFFAALCHYVNLRFLRCHTKSRVSRDLVQACWAVGRLIGENKRHGVDMTSTYSRKRPEQRRQLLKVAVRGHRDDDDKNIGIAVAYIKGYQKPRVLHQEHQNITNSVAKDWDKRYLVDNSKRSRYWTHWLATLTRHFFEFDKYRGCNLFNNWTISAAINLII